MSSCAHLYHQAADMTIDVMGEQVSIRCRALLFDMDGTLVDSTQVVERAWRGWAVRHNLALEDALSFSHGRPTIATPGSWKPRNGASLSHRGKTELVSAFRSRTGRRFRVYFGVRGSRRKLRVHGTLWCSNTASFKYTVLRTGCTSTLHP